MYFPGMKGTVLDMDTFDRNDVDLTPLTDLPVSWKFHSDTLTEQRIERVENCTIAITNKIIFDRELIGHCQDLKLILAAATGTDNIDLGACKEKNITVCNVRHYATPAVAQHAIALMLNLATSQFQFVRDVKQGRWQQSLIFCLLDHPIMELEGKNLGIVGYGTLGRKVAYIAKALGMNILVCQRPGSNDAGSDRIPFQELLKKSDFISLHCPLTSETRNLFGAREFDTMKSSAYLVNTARGAIVDSRALVNAVKTGQIAGAGVDVLEKEPPDGDHPLLTADLPSLIVTPHNAWATRESRQRLVGQLASNINAWLDGRAKNVVG